MKQPKQQLHLVMDESDAPYREDEYTWTLEDDLTCIRIAKEHGLEFEPGSRLDKIAKEHGL